MILKQYFCYTGGSSLGMKHARRLMYIYLPIHFVLAAMTHLLLLTLHIFLQRHMLSWEAATERLLNASSVTVGEARRRRRALDEMAYVFHYHLVLDNRWDIVSKLLQGRESSIRSNTVLDFVRGDK